MIVASSLRLKLRASLRAIAISAALTFSATSSAAITSAFDGNWYDNTHSGQGFIFETFPAQNGETILFVIFFTYDGEGKPLFFTSQKVITPGLMRMDLLKPTVRGMLTADGTLPAPTYEPAGVLELNISDCEDATAKVILNPATQGVSPKIRVGTGSFRLRRLGATTQAKRCTGGISDNSFATSIPAFVDESFSRPMLDARINFVRRPDASEFRLELSKLPPGRYELVVDNVVKAETVVVADLEGNTRGSMLLRSPALAFTDELDFIPSIAVMTLRGADPINSDYRQVFSFSEPVRPIASGNDFGFSSSFPSALRESTFLPGEVTGQTRGSSNDFRFNVERSNSGLLNELRIQANGIEAGFYDVFVNGDRFGRIQINQRNANKTFGEIIFRSPVSAGSYPLEFQTVGAIIELKRAGVTDYRFTIAP
jgi:hypothetical protein